MSQTCLKLSEVSLLCDNKSDGGLSDITLVGSLWNQAVLRLDSKQQALIREISSSNSCKPDELLGAVKKEIVKCEAKQWQIYKTRSGRRIFLRDIFKRIVGFLEKITAIGDNLAQYDPTHLTIPWAIARFLLIVSRVLSQPTDDTKYAISSRAFLFLTRIRQL